MELYIHQQTPTAWLNTEIIRNTFKLSEQRFDMVIEYNKNNTRHTPKNPCTGDVMHDIGVRDSYTKYNTCSRLWLTNYVEFMWNFFFSLNIKTKQAFRI